MRRDASAPPHLPLPVPAGLFEAWLDASDDGVLAVDAEGRVVLHNPAASRVTGLSPGAGVGRDWREVLRLDEAVAQALWSARLSGARTQVMADVLCAQGNVRSAEVSASPWRTDEGGSGVLLLIRDLAVLCRQRTSPGGRPGYGGLVGDHPSMRALYDLIDAVAPSDAPVLIEGEPGTGKELVTQLLHARSRRAERPLIAVACAAPAPAALERELFGAARGAATGGVGTAVGRAELAHGGTLFLREVGASPAPVQARLLRLLAAGEVTRVGDPAPRRIDVRVIASTSRPLERQVEGGGFLPELYHRLRVVRIGVPPLRERGSDVPLLVEHFLAKHGAPAATATPEALVELQAHAWPGNVRELERLVRQAVVTVPLGPGAVFGREHLPPGWGAAAPPPRATADRDREDRRTLLLRALSSHGGNRTAAARALGIGRATFYRWWREAGLASESPAQPSPS
ncbi:MAG TPA: sigma 54-interacting transcriptional regulator [Gemmatimonadales bacterium]|nr:sigma 54-interacting transcriptional regulator [Gemmatimonadales bacterium]